MDSPPVAETPSASPPNPILSDPPGLCKGPDARRSALCHDHGVRSLRLVAVALLTTLIVTASSAATRPRPSLSLHGNPPLVVDGAHFHRHERVKVTPSRGASVTVRANSHGTFTTTLRGIPVDRCNGLIVRARGSAGSTAVVKRPPLRQCLLVRTPASTS